MAASLFMRPSSGAHDMIQTGPRSREVQTRRKRESVILD